MACARSGVANTRVETMAAKRRIITPGKKLGLDDTPRPKFKLPCDSALRANQVGTFALASATIARNSLLGLKTGTGRAATSTGAPVRGLRAMRVLRCRILNVPNPRTSMLCCSASAAFTASRNESTTRAQSFLEIRGPAVRAICAVTFSTRSAFVIRPPCRAQGQSRRGANIRAYLLCVKSLEELLEVPLGVVRAG